MLPDKVIIITGAAGGIGRAIAKKFAAAKYFITLADIDESGLGKLSKELIAEHECQCLVIPGDLSDPTYLKMIVDKTIEEYQGINVLVNNAAWRTVETLRTIDLNTWKKTIEICLTAPAFLTKWAAEEMETRNHGGVIVNVSSIMSLRPSGTSPAYIASKGAMDSLTKELAITYGRNGIRVLGVSPGFIDTDLSRDYQNDDGKNISDRLADELIDFLPVPRPGKTDEIADAVYWMCLDSTAYITGTNLIIDGGLLSNFSKYSLKKIQFPKEF